MERQYIVFSAVAAALFAALIALAFFNPLQQTEGDETDTDVIKVRKGEQGFLRYSFTVARMIQDLPSKNSLELEVSSELRVTNLAGLNGEVRYTDMEITWFEDGEENSINHKDFKTIEYKFYPDIGNKTRYVYENADYIAKADNAQVIVSVMPLSTAEVGEKYTVRMLLHTGGVIDYAIDEKIVEVVA